MLLIHFNKIVVCIKCKCQHDEKILIFKIYLLYRSHSTNTRWAGLYAAKNHTHANFDDSFEFHCMVSIKENAGLSSWKAHINHISMKIKRSVGILSAKLRSQYYVNTDIFCNLYFALIYPLLIYGIVSWETLIKLPCNIFLNIKNQIK